MSVVLALDIGTSKVAAIAYDCSRRETVAVFSAANAATAQGLPAGRHEQCPEMIYQECAKLLRRLADSGLFPVDSVREIAVSGQMHGVLLVDDALAPLSNLITWCDQRASALTASLDRASWPVERTGCYLHPGYGGATLAVLAAERAIPAGSAALTIADFVAARLCGVKATDSTHAASWGIFDVRGGHWDVEVISRLGIPAGALPEIRPGLSRLGPLTLEGLGLPGTVDVRLPLGDNQASFIGSCGLGNDALLLNLGTGGQISLPCPAFTVEASLETRPMPWGGFLLVGSSLCGGRAYAHLKDFFQRTLRDFTGKALADDEVYGTMARLADEAGETLEVDTRFAGTRMNPAARGTIGAIATNNFTPGALCRGYLLGMTRELTGMFAPEAYRAFDKVMVSGNATRRNPLARRFIEQETGLPCVMADIPEEAATGAAMAAAKAAGLL